MYIIFVKRIITKFNQISGVMTKVNEKSSLEKSIKSHGNSTKAKKKCAKTNQIVQEPNSYSNNNPRRREFQEILLSPLGISTTHYFL